MINIPFCCAARFEPAHRLVRHSDFPTDRPRPDSINKAGRMFRPTDPLWSRPGTRGPVRTALLLNLTPFEPLPRGRRIYSTGSRNPPRRVGVESPKHALEAVTRQKSASNGRRRTHASARRTASKKGRTQCGTPPNTRGSATPSAWNKSRTSCQLPRASQRATARVPHHADEP